MDTTDPVVRSIDSLKTPEFRMANKTYVFVKQHSVSSKGTPGCMQQLPSQVLVSEPPHEDVQRAENGVRIIEKLVTLTIGNIGGANSKKR